MTRGLGAEPEPILPVWINPDPDLVDLTITTTTKGSHGHITKTSEVVHTNQKHPFFTLEHGFLLVGQIKLGMHLIALKLDPARKPGQHILLLRIMKQRGGIRQNNAV